MSYIVRAQITAKLPAVFLTEALDDDGDGVEDDGILDQIIADQSNTVESYVSGRFATPFADPAPVAIRMAALTFVLYAIYARRPTGDKNPYSADFNSWKERLRAIGETGKGLDAGLEGQPAASAGFGSGSPVPQRTTGVDYGTNS